MEVGSISKWLLKEGDSFAPGQAICEVETDKATVTYEATEEGYIAKILVGAGEIKVRSIFVACVCDELHS
jgi:pyruvate dehydrogenase E2 component (dihydrolipoamide acetyltransferase)